MKIGDIYWVNFEPRRVSHGYHATEPSVGREYQKIRPALVIQSEKITQKSPYVTVLPITSEVEKWAGPDVLMLKDHKNALFKDSVVKVRQIATFDKSRILGKIGVASSPVIRQVRGYLRRHFQL